MPSPDPQTLEAKLAPFGQAHLLADWTALDEGARARLADQIEKLDLQLLRRLFLKQEAEAAHGEIVPPQTVGLPESVDDWLRRQQAAAVGEELLAGGKIAIVMVAGGQGSRLGFDGPKGAFPIGPASGNSLFQMHAEQVLALSRRHGQALRFLIMTSEENDAATRNFFGKHRHFGLEPEQVAFFTQGMLPALDAATGAILRSAPGQLALSPNGHGGTLEALHRGGHLQRLRKQGVETLFYFQVDNPLVKIADAAFLGLHRQAGAEVSVKVVRKTEPSEAIGLVVQRDGAAGVVEYTELSEAQKHERAPDGGLRFWAGNTAIHLFETAFLQRLAEAETMLPYHRAFKKMPCLDAAGVLAVPDTPNAYKFEMFIFDALPLARRTLAVETEREEEFEPLKNGDGPYSPSTVRQAISDRAAAWLGFAGVPVARTGEGRAAFPLEISPLFALDAEETRDKAAGLGEIEGPLFLGPDFTPPPIQEPPAEEEGE